MPQYRPQWPTLWRSSWQVAVLAVAILKTGTATVLGALKLDNYTFDKVLGIPNTTFLVKFDKSYAYGDGEDEFTELCKLAHPVPNFFVAEVPVQEWGDKENDDLREKFTLNKDDFPVFLMFPPSDKKGVKYSGEVKAEALSAWLRKMEIPIAPFGTIGELDAIARLYLDDGSFPVGQIIAARKLVLEKYPADRKAALYVKIMERLGERGEGYLRAEETRIRALLEGRLTAEKIGELNDKLKVIAALAENNR